MARKRDVNLKFEQNKLGNTSVESLILEECETEEQNKKWPFPGFGMLCALLSAIFFACNTLIVKILDLHPIELGLTQCSLQVLMLLPIVQYKSYTDKLDILGPKDLKVFLWLRGLTGSSAMIFLYLAVDELSVGNAVTISYLSMILVPFIARIFLKESLMIMDIIFAIVSLTGVVLIAQPTFLFPIPEGGKAQSALGILYAVLTATLMASAIVIVRKLGRETYPPLNILYYSASGSLTTTIFLCVLGVFQPPCRKDLLYVFLLGISGVLSQCFIILGLQAERAGTIGILRSVEIIIVYVFQVTILGDIPTMLCLIGAALVFSSSIGIGIRKIFNERRKRKSIAKT